MNVNEFHGLSEILSALSPDDLFSVMGTITKHMVRAETPDEALKAAITYSENASTLLRRRKITRTILFEYLRRHNITVPPDSEKPHFVKACLKYWQSPDDHRASSLTDIEEDQITEQNPIFEVTPVNLEVAQLGNQFTVWFFNGLNSLQDFGPQHFWPDCKLFLNLKTHGAKNEEFCIMGSNNVVSSLTKYIMKDNYFFKPNTYNGAIQSQQEQHGLVKVCVSGIIHQRSNCVGLFDAAFGLVSDPVLNHNWKIKVIQLMLQVTGTANAIGQNQISVPYLCQ